MISGPLRTSILFSAIILFGVVVSSAFASEIKLSPDPGQYPDNIRVSMKFPENWVVYYTLDGSNPTVNSSIYSAPVNIEEDTVLRYFETKPGNKRGIVKEAFYGISHDTTDEDEFRTIADPPGGTFAGRITVSPDVLPPSTTATPPAGFYKLPLNLALTTSEDDAVIHYTLDGSDPTEDSNVYKDSIVLKGNTVLKYFAVDKFGNAESINTSEYLFGNTPPVTRPDPPGGEYFPPVYVLLSAEPGSEIHYTIDGSDPDLDSSVYTGDNIVFLRSGTLKFFAVDRKGNREATQEHTYSLVSGVWRKYARGVYLIPSATDGKVFWMGTDTGLIRYRVGSGSRKFVGEREGLLGSEINDLVLDENGALWVATDLGLNRYIDNGGFMRFDHESGLPGRTVLSLGVDIDNTIWAGTTEGVVQIKDDIILQILTEKDGLIDNTVLSVAVDALGNKWFGTSKGLAMYDNGKWNYYTKTDGLIHNEVRTVAVDSMWNVWSGTPRGISIYDGTNWKSYTRKDGLPSNSIVLITPDPDPDPDGDVWVATRAGVVRFSDGEWIREESP